MVTILQIHPVAFELFGWPVYWYGLIIGFAMLLGYFIYRNVALGQGLDAEFVFDLYFWSVIWGFIGARIYYVLFSWNQYREEVMRIFFIWEGGIAIYGGIIGGLCAILYYTRRAGVNPWTVLDAAAPAIIAAQAIGRWGNFINQEAHGGIVERTSLERFALPDWLIEQMHIRGAYYHPTFLYESLWNVLGLILIYLYYRKAKERMLGDLVALYCLWYGFGRYWIEGLRTDSLMIGPWRVSQLVSVGLMLLGLFIWIYQRQQGHQAVPPSTYSKEVKE